MSRQRLNARFYMDYIEKGASFNLKDFVIVLSIIILTVYIVTMYIVHL